MTSYENLFKQIETSTIVLFFLGLFVTACCCNCCYFCWTDLFCPKTKQGGLILSRPPEPTPEQTPAPTFQGTNPAYTGSSVYPNLTPGYSWNNPAYPGGNLTPYNIDPTYTGVNVTPAYYGENLTPKDSPPSREANLTPGFNAIQDSGRFNVTPDYSDNKINVGENLNPEYSENTMPAYNLSPFYPEVRGPPGNVGNPSLLVVPSAVFAGSRNSLNKDECGV